jgi:cytochrome c biogenesis protein CcmG, thiol:disulfide interchange protein DsbE
MFAEKQKIILGGLILGICLVLGWALSRVEEPSIPIMEGSWLPDCSFSDPDGQLHWFSEYRGQVVLINFWATWCPPCLEELPSLSGMAETLKGSPIVFLTFSADYSWDPVHELWRNRNYHLPVFADFQRKLAAQFGTFKFPETYIADKRGKVRLKVIGATNWMAPEMVDFVRKLMVE